LFLGFSLFADSKLKLEKIDISKFPKIQLSITENKSKPIQGEKIHIIETKDSNSKVVSTYTVVKLNQTRTVKLILSLQATDNLEKLNQVKQNASVLIQNLSKEDRVGLQIFGNDTYYLSLNLDKNEALARIENMQLAKGNRTVAALNFLLSQFKEEEFPSFWIVFLPDSSTKPDEKVSTLTEKARKLNLPIHIYGKEDTRFLTISQSTFGEFYNFEKASTLTEIQSKIYDFRKTPPIIEYNTAFQSDINFLKKSIIDVRIRVGNTEFKSKYELGLFNLLKFKFSNLEFFFTFMFILLFVCILLLYAITNQMRKREMEEERRLREEELLSNDLYYHENLVTELEPSTFINYSSTEIPDEEDESSNLDLYNYNPDEDFADYTHSDSKSSSNYSSQTLALATDELSKAENYERVVLIIKEGPNPGRQFTVNKEEISIGNSPSNDLVLIDSTVSPMHAKIKKIKNVYVLFDMVSKTGVYLNGSKLLRPKPLHDFDEIQIGKVKLLFKGK
jgi:hypothetical protein